MRRSAVRGYISPLVPGHCGRHRASETVGKRGEGRGGKQARGGCEGEWGMIIVPTFASRTGPKAALEANCARQI